MVEIGLKSLRGRELSCPAAKFLLLKPHFPDPGAQRWPAHGRRCSATAGRACPILQAAYCSGLEMSEYRDSGGRVCISGDIMAAKGQNREIKAPGTLRKVCANIVAQSWAG